MIYSRSAEYAIRGCVHMAALAPGEYALVKSIAAEAGIPAHFLAKILQEPARGGDLDAAHRRGRGRRRPLPALHRREPGVQRSRPLRHARLLEGAAVAYHRLFGGDFSRRCGEGPGGEAPAARP